MNAETSDHNANEPSVPPLVDQEGRIAIAQEPEQVSAFETESRETLRRLRASFLALMAAVPGTPGRAADVGRALSVDKKTAWQVFKIISSDDPFACASHVPTGKALERVLRAAGDRGVPISMTDGVRATTRAFDELVMRYAGDRSVFDTMVSSIVDADAPVELAHYRAAFRANVHIYEASCRVASVCQIFHHNLDDPTRLDLAVLQGKHDLRQTGGRPYLPVGSTTLRRDTDGPVAGCVAPLVTDDGLNIGFLPEFSTSSSSQISLANRDEKRAEIQMRLQGAGLPGRATCVFGHVLRAPGKVRRFETDEHVESSSSVRSIPTELLNLDVLVHTPTFGTVVPKVSWLRDAGRNENIPDPRRHPDKQLAVPPGCLTELAGGIDSLATPELPRQAELVRWALNKLGWEQSGYQIFRCRLRYPLVPSTLSLMFQLPE